MEGRACECSSLAPPLSHNLLHNMRSLGVWDNRYYYRLSSFRSTVPEPRRRDKLLGLPPPPPRVARGELKWPNPLLHDEPIHTGIFKGYEVAIL